MNIALKSVGIATLAMTAVPALADDAPAMVELRQGEHIDADYRSKDRLRVFVRVPSHSSAMYARELALEQLAMMTKEKGFDRFAVTKLSSCGSMVMTQGGRPISAPLHHQCRLLGEMLREGEEPKKIDKHEITYFTVNEALARRAMLGLQNRDALTMLIQAMQKRAAEKPSAKVEFSPGDLAVKGEGLAAALNDDSSPEVRIEPQH